MVASLSYAELGTVQPQLVMVTLLFFAASLLYQHPHQNHDEEERYQHQNKRGGEKLHNDADGEVWVTVFCKSDYPVTDDEPNSYSWNDDMSDIVH